VQSVTASTTSSAPAADDAASECVAAARPTPAVHEVEYDEHGQTWDVHGAEFDPEILGQAIQAHLQHIISQHHRGADAVTSRDDVIPGQSRGAAPGRHKRDVIGRFFQRYMRTTDTPRVGSNS